MEIAFSFNKKTGNTFVINAKKIAAKLLVRL